MRSTAFFLLAFVFIAARAAWAPLDTVAGLFGTKPLSAWKATARTSRAYPLHDVEHTPCRGGAGCGPKGACEHIKCAPKIGHYWYVDPEEQRDSIPGWLAGVLPAIGQPYRMMTTNGVLEASPGFWFTRYRLSVSNARWSSLPLTPRPRGSLPALSFAELCASDTCFAPQGDAADDVAADTLPGMDAAGQVGLYVALPCLLFFILYVLLS
jgi:hypothetical protein